MSDLDFQIGWNGAAAARGFSSLAADARSAGQGFRALGTDAEQAGRAVKKAQGDAAAAARRVAIEEAKLKEIRDNSKAKVSQVLAAEDRLANARRKQADAIDQVESASKHLESTQSRLTSTQSRMGKGFDWIDRNSAGLNRLGDSMLRVGVVAGLGLGVAVKRSADFEAAVSNVKATGDDAAASIDQLRQEAIKYGASTAFSATEAADAQAELIKANVSVTDTINGGLKGALDLAAAGSLGVADAAGIMATAMSQFGLDGTKASHVADLLAAGAGKAQGEVSDFAEALKYVGPNSKAAGVSIEETVGVLAEFANVGILGSQAGTSLRSMLVSLTAPAGVGAATMEKYGISVRDAQGDFIGFAGVAGQLHDKLGKLSKAERDAALARIFGKESLTAAIALYEGGAAGVQKWTQAVDDSGFAARVAGVKMDNLKGDLENFLGAADAAFINAGSGANEAFRGMTQGATGVVDWFNKLPPSIQKGTVAVGGLVAVTGLGVGGLAKLAVAASETRTALSTFGVSAKVAGIAAGTIGAGITVAALAIGHFAQKQAEAKARTDLLTDALLASKGAVDQNIAAMRAKSLEDSGALASAQKLGISIADLTQASLGNAAASDRVNTQLGRMAIAGQEVGTGFGAQGQAMNRYQTDLNNVRNAISSGTDELAGARDAYDRQTEAQDAAGVSGNQAATGIRAAGNAAQDAGIQASGAAEDMYSMVDAALALSGAEIDFEAAIDDATAAAKRNGKGLDVGTAKGRNNQAALNRLAATAKLYVKQLDDAAKTQDVSGASVEKAAAKYEKGRSAFIKTARAMGATAKEARDMADELFQIPPEVRSQVVLAGTRVSKKEAKELNTALRGIPPEKRAKIVAIANTKGATAARAEIAKVKGKNPKIDVGSNAKAVSAATRAAIGAVKGKNPKIDVGSNGKAVSAATRAAIASVKNRRVKIDVDSNGVRVAHAVKDAINALRNRSLTITTHKKTVKDHAFGGLAGEGYSGFDSGGQVTRGSFTPRADDVDARLSRNEWVIQEPSARKYGYARMDAVNDGTALILLPGERPGFAYGGPARYERPVRFERMVGGGGGSTVINMPLHVHAPNYVGTPSDLVRALDRLEKTGALDTFKRRMLR